MNAQAAIARPVVSPEPTAEQARYQASIRALLPACNEFQTATRADIAAMRDRAAMAQRKCCDQATGILAEATRLASYAVFAPIGTKRLLHIHSALVFMLEAARSIERAKNPY